MAAAGGVLAGAGLTIGAVPASALAPPRPRRPTGVTAPTTPALAEQELIDGNARWQPIAQLHPRQDWEARKAVENSQAPWALVVSCIDSRVPPELVFDQGLGDLAVARSAGQVLDMAMYGSILYSVEHLHVKTVVVLGHEKCGAVQSAIKLKDNDNYPLSARIKPLVKDILPSVPPAGTADREKEAIDANIRRIRSLILQESEIASRVAAGTLSVIGMRYELNSWGTSRVLP